MKDRGFKYRIQGSITVVKHILPVLVIVSLFLVISVPAFSQNKNQGNSKPVAGVTGKSMSSIDSVQVNVLFFDGTARKNGRKLCPWPKTCLIR